MLDELRKYPYYDDYDSSKQYTQLLAVPGRVAQSREITQIQSVLKDIVKSLGDSILQNGNIVEGCQVSTYEDNGQHKARVTAGKVYLNGMVLPVPETVLDISAQGTEYIGVKLVEEIITEAADASLRDPAQGYANFNQPGCNRLKSYVKVTLNDSSASIITELVDGDILVEKYAPEYDTLTQTLARRTYDESGSYIVEGLSVRVEDYPEDNDRFNVVVEAGKAYVLGYELRIPAARRIDLPRSLDTTNITVRHIRYSSGSMSTRISDTPYIKSLIEVSGAVRKTVNQRITSNLDEIMFDEPSILKVISVTQGDREYTVGTSSSTGDCYLYVSNDNRGHLKWNGTDNFPVIGSDYSVVYEYEHIFMEGTDYELSMSADGSQNIAWKGTVLPVDNAQLTISYYLYLARKDLVYIDQYGNVQVLQGDPAIYGFEVAPQSPVNTLPLAYIMNPPSGDVTNDVNLKIIVSNIGLTRFTMNDINNLLTRIRTIEYDQAVLSLNDEAKSYETVNDKRGIFTDPLIDLSKIDYYYNLSEGLIVDASLPTCDNAIDTTAQICYLPILSNVYDADYNANSTTAQVTDRGAVLGKRGEYVALSQDMATKSFLINPYSLFPQLPELSITPATDFWVEPEYITVNVSQKTSEVVSTSTRNYESTKVLSGNFKTYTNTTSSTKDTHIGTKTDTSSTESVIDETAITYIRSRDIQVEGLYFPPNLDNIACYFDDNLVALTPTGTTVAGTRSGTLRSDAAGRVSGTFTIPEGILSGIREVRLESDIVREGYQNKASAMYSAQGVARTIQTTVTTLTTILYNRETTYNRTTYVDPVGQTFVLDRMSVLSGIDLYFEDKPEGTVPVTVDIREVVNGTITATVLGHKTLPAGMINTSSDSTAATRFTFEEPVILEANKEYAFVIRSTSTRYSVWVAELGEDDMITKEPVLSNPYMIGVMMSSSNNSSWTNHQTTDIKFRLIADNYNDKAEVLFNTINAVPFCRLLLFSDNTLPKGTYIDWYYSLDSGVNFTKFSPYSTQLLSEMKNSVTLKAVLSKDSDVEVSPILTLDSVGLVLSSFDNSEDGWYITKEITGLDPYTHVDLVLDTYTYNAGTEVEVWVNNGTGMVQAELQPGARTMNYNWKESTYTVDVSSSTRCRIYVKLKSSNPYYTPAFRKLRAIMS